jgi:AbrB family looped-hinge helix DNA binding protein
MNSRKKSEGFEEETQSFDYENPSSLASSSKTLNATVGEGGRLVIPAELRKLMEVSPGEGVALRVVDGVLHVVSATVALKRIHAITSKLKKPGVSLVDEFLADRRAEQQASDERFDRLHREAMARGSKTSSDEEPR